MASYQVPVFIILVTNATISLLYHFITISASHSLRGHWQLIPLAAKHYIVLLTNTKSFTQKKGRGIEQSKTNTQDTKEFLGCPKRK